MRGEPANQLSIQVHLETKDCTQGVVLWMVYPPKKINDMFFIRDYKPRDLNRMHYMLGRQGKLCTPFFKCPFAKTIWNQKSIPSMDATWKTSFWDSIWRGGHKRKEEGGRILAVLWAIWLHRNDKLFRGRASSTNGVTYAVEVLWRFGPQSHEGRWGDRSVIVGRSLFFK